MSRRTKQITVTLRFPKGTTTEQAKQDTQQVLDNIKYMRIPYHSGDALITLDVAEADPYAEGRKAGKESIAEHKDIHCPYAEDIQIASHNTTEWMRGYRAGRAEEDTNP